MLEEMNRLFGSLDVGLFGGSEDVRPKDILRLILAAMEDKLKERFKNVSMSRTSTFLNLPCVTKGRKSTGRVVYQKKFIENPTIVQFENNLGVSMRSTHSNTQCLKRLRSMSV